MGTFTLTIDTGNAAFGADGSGAHGAPELARILRETADRLDVSGIDADETARLRDINGNAVGSWTFTAPPVPAGPRATCPECGRAFDLSDEDDAAEWSYGHDCEDV